MGSMPDGLQPGKGLCRDVGDAVVGQIETLQFFQDFHSRHGKRVENVVLEVKLVSIGVKSFHHFLHGISQNFQYHFSTKKKQIF